MKRQHPTDPDLFRCPKCQGYKARNEFYFNKQRFSEISGECKKCIIKRAKKNHRFRCPTRICAAPRIFKTAEEKKEYKHQWYLAHRKLAVERPRVEKLCIVEGCNEKAHGRTYCNKHYTRWRKYSSPETIKISTRKKICEKCGSERKLLNGSGNKDYRKMVCPKCRLARQRTRERRQTNILSDGYIKYIIRQSVRDLPIIPEIIEWTRQRIILKRTLKEFKKWREDHESDYSDVDGKQRPDEKDYEGRCSAG